MLFWLPAFTAGLVFYPGAKLFYAFFSFSFLALLFSAFYRHKSYGYIFLSIFLWLGFWLKATIHFLFTYAYLEPTGLFDFSPAGWDQVLMVSAAGALALMLARIVYGFAGGLITTRMPSAVYSPPAWYGPARKWIWPALIGFILGVTALNSYLGIHQVGLYPRTILPWPGNALIAWTLNIGAVMCIAVFSFWDILTGRSLLPALSGIAAESIIYSASVLSRGVFIYHAAPLLAVILWFTISRAAVSKSRILSVSGLFLAAFAGSVFFVNSYRTGLYSGPSVAQAAPTEKKAAEPGLVNALRHNRHLRQVSGLFVDRWVGLEGVMAVTAYPGKSGGLLLRALTEKRTLTESPMYERISGSDFQTIDEAKHQFGRLPGPAALFYYSGRVWVVFAGMFLIGLLVFYFENAVWFLTSNPLMCALLGMMAANNAAQFGSAPVQMLPTYAMVLLALLSIWFIENKAAQLFSNP